MDCVMTTTELRCVVVIVQNGQGDIDSSCTGLCDTTILSNQSQIVYTDFFSVQNGSGCDQTICFVNMKPLDVVSKQAVPVILN